MTLRATTVTWVGGSGDWDVATNWSTGQLPGTNDDVVIGSGPAITVTHSSGTDTINSIASQQPFQLSGGLLTVISAVQMNSTFTVSGGTINAGLVDLEGDWSNAGTIIQTNAFINPNDTIYLTGVGTNSGTLLISGADIGAYGVVINSGTIAATASFVIGGGGTISGGTITLSNGAAMILSARQTLDGVTVNGDLSVGSLYNEGDTLTVTDGLTLNGTLLVGNPTNGNTGTVIFQGTQALGGNGTVIFGINPANQFSVAGSLTLGPGILAHGQNASINAASAVLINQGTISCDVNGGLITINAEPFVNEGLAQGINGGGLSLAEQWSSSGTIIETNGSLYLASYGTNSGTVILSGASLTVGHVLYNYGGTIDVTASSVLFGIGGDGGSIGGGTITTANGASLIVGGGGNFIDVTLGGLTFNGTLDVGYSSLSSYPDGNPVLYVEGISLNGKILVGNPTNNFPGIIHFQGSQTLGGNGTVIFGNGNGNTLDTWPPQLGESTTIGPGITVRGENGQIGSGENCSIINQGTISCDVPGGTIVVNAQPFSNQGVVGAQSGTIDLNGSYDLSAGTLSVGINSPADFGVINLSGNPAALNGSLSVNLNNDYVPEIGNSFAILNYNSETGSFTNFNLPDAVGWQTNYGGTSFMLSVANVLPGLAAPRIMSQPVSQSIAAGGNATFTVEANGTPPLNYQWQLNGTNLANGAEFSGTTTAALTINPVSTSDAGTYFVIITNVYGAITSSVAVLSTLSTTNSSPSTNYTGVWSEAPPMPTARWQSAAGLIGGQIYVVAGYNPAIGGHITQVEAYDIATGSWASKNPQPFQQDSSAYAVINGLLYEAGGANCCVGIADLSAYDPADQSWTYLTPLPQAEEFPAADTINGLMYVAGVSYDDPTVATLDVFDPGSDTWTAKTPMPTPRWSPGACFINGILYVVGGYDPGSGNVLNVVEAYDPASDSWTTKAPMPTPRTRLAVAALNGILYAIGGVDATGTNVFNTVEAYDPALNVWAQQTPMPTARASLAAVVANGSIYAIGGYAATALARIEVFTPSSSLQITNQPVSQNIAIGGSATFTVGATGTPPLYYQWQQNGTNLANGAEFSGTTTAMLTINPVSTSDVGNYSVIITNVYGAVTSSVATLTLTNDVLAQANWTLLAPSGGPPAARTGQTAVFNTANGRMIVFGGGTGLNGPSGLVNDVWIFQDARANNGDTWQLLAINGTSPSPREYQSAVYDQANNRMIIFGGDPNGGYCFVDLNDVWVLTNADGTTGNAGWTQLNPTGPFPSVRSSASAVYDLADNRLIFYGGNEQCELPDDDLWVLTNANGLGGTPGWTQLSTAGGGPGPRTYHSAVYDPASNRMILFGGQTATIPYTNDTWILSNANGLGGTPTWTFLNPTGPLPPPRYGSGAAYDPVLNTLVVFGGESASGYTNDTWILSNANGLGATSAWTKLTPTGPLPSGRQASSCVGVPDAGRIVMFGGQLDSGVPLNDVWALQYLNSNPPSLNMEPGNQTVPVGASATFTLGATGTPPLYYQWQQNGTNLANGAEFSGTTTAVLTINPVSTSDAGNYSVAITNVYGAVTSSVATLTVITTPAIITNPMSGTASPGGQVTLNVSASGSDLSYQWNFNGTAIADAKYSSYTVTNFAPANIGDYSVTVSNAAGSVTSPSATLASVGISLFTGVIVDGPLGSNYLIQSTPSLLSNWITLTNVALPTQPYIYIDYTSLTNRQQFYRAVPQ